MMSITLLSGCGANNTTNNANQGSTDGANAPKETTAPVAEGYVPEKLTVQFVPSQNADTLEAKAKPLEKLLGVSELIIRRRIPMNKDNTITCEILVTSDLHGHFLPVDYRTGEKRQKGLATIASLIKQERSYSPELILVDNGDLIQGTPLTYYAATHYSNELNPGIAALNELKYDAAIIGNHEFNFGKPLLNKAVQDSNFPWLSAGIVDSTTSKPAFGKPYIIKWVAQKIKVAILGVTTHYIPHWENPAHIQGLQFKDSLETVKRWCAMIRAEEQPDLLVVAYHGGFERDLSSGEPVERLTGENQAYAMCTEVEGLDVLITGHQHRSIAGELNGVTILQPGCNGHALGKISVIFQKENDHWKIQSKHTELLPVNEMTAADDVILELSSALESETQTWLDEQIGTVIGDLSISSANECRLADHPFIEFMNKVQMEATGVDISTAALLSNDSKGFSNTITRRDILSNFIYPNTLTVLRLTGQDIRDALEQTAKMEDSFTCGFRTMQLVVYSLPHIIIVMLRFRFYVGGVNDDFPVLT